MRRFALIVLVVLIGAFMFVGCDNKAAMEKMAQLTEENAQLTEKLTEAEAKIVELEAKIKELAPEGEATEGEEMKEGEEVKETKETPKEEPKEEVKKDPVPKSGKTKVKK